MAASRLHELFVLNVALQLFDGVATWCGVAHWPEGNPLVRAAMGVLGTQQALLLYKAQACACLLLLRRSAAPMLAVPVLRRYFEELGLSFVPWMTRFLSLAMG